MEVRARKLCVCKAVSEAEFVGMLSSGNTREDIVKRTGIGTQCGLCLPEVDRVYGEFVAKNL